MCPYINYYFSIIDTLFPIYIFIFYFQLQLKVEIVSVYDRVRVICQSLKHRARHSDTTMRPDMTVHQIKVWNKNYIYL